MLLHNLVMRPWAYWRPRDGGYWTREDWALTGHFAALCNEFAFSDGELVIETWKHLQLGPVIGKTTGGGEVGSGGGYTLIDGGALYIPNYAAFADGEWLVEGRGASPDIDVDEDPNAVLAGRDPQLDKAIEVLKANLAKNPIKPPAHPAFPKKNG
jgi:tricorn protease